MNLSLDGYIAVPGDELDWSRPSDELFQWWLDQERAIGLFLYGHKLWETTSSHWPTGDQQPSPGIDEYAIVTHPVLVGGGIPFFTALDSWVNLNLVGTRTFRSRMVLNRYETRR